MTPTATDSTHFSYPAVVIGGGPAGLMAAEQLLQAGFAVALFDAMPSVGRKFLLAGIGGLNLTHSEPFPDFMSRYAERQAELSTPLQAFDATALRAWALELGIATFVGTSGRIFPREMKAAPLLRAWLSRLKRNGLQLYTRHRWQGWTTDTASTTPPTLSFATPQGELRVQAQVVVLALGGGSWKKLGSDGAWVSLLRQRGIAIAPLQAANCGFLAHWSAVLRQQAGQPIKPVSLRFTDLGGQTETRQGELILTERGLEGSLLYAYAARLREMIQAQGQACFYLDLLPHLSLETLRQRLTTRPPHKSLSSFLKGRLHLDSVKTALLFEYLPRHPTPTAEHIADLLKALPITVLATTPIDEAISTAGGVCFSALTADLMVAQQPGLFCAGEMLDWEAPTGGYLLTAVMATGKQAGLGAVRFLQALPAEKAMTN